MSATRSIGFFSLGVPSDRWQLPHPPFEFPAILLIRRVLLESFNILRAHKFPLATAKEDEITEALRDVIENRLRQTGEVSGFNKNRYDFVVRQGQWKNYNGTVLTKAPDMFFKLRDDEGHRKGVLSEFDGLFVEAKPVDATHPVGSKYCDDGLIRFVRGDYAWAMQEAMMLAYARDGRTITGNLLAAISEPARMASLKTETAPQPSSSVAAGATPYAEAVHISKHARSFPWPDAKRSASDITILHIWFDCA